MVKKTTKPTVKRGRPPVEIDLDRLRKMGSLMSTQAEVAAHFDISTSSVEKYLRVKKYREAFDAGKEDTKSRLRAVQIQTALSGNVTMMIWLGKQYLGQREPQVGAPVNVQILPFPDD